MKKIALTLSVVCSLIMASCFKEIDPSVTNNTTGGSGSGNVNITSSLTAFYTFDDSTTNDLSGHGRHASMVGGASIEDEAGNPCLKLLFADAGYLNIPYNLLGDLEHWTVCFWVKGLTAGNVFAAQSSSNGSDGDHPMLWADQNGFLKMKPGYGDIDYYGYQISYNYSANSDTWHHYTLLRDGSSTVKFYADGVLVDNLSVSFGNSEATKIVFGGNKNGGYSVTPGMKLDNIRFYGRTLSANEIKYIYDLEK